MNEQEWLECADPLFMLSYLRAGGQARKSILLICACLRRIWEILPDEGRKWVELGEATARENVDPDGLPNEDAEYALQVAGESARWDGIVLAVIQVFHGFWELPVAERGEGNPEWKVERGKQAALVRDIFGNPFRPVVIDPAWLTWRDGTIPKIAQAIDDERRFADMPVLADALEEAGCSDPNILSHCRQPGDHVRGCWVVDRLLGKG
jgi:hypothetical protein